MKRIMAALFAGALIFAGVASAATPAQRIGKLEKQVGTLTKTIKTQTKQIKQLQNLVVAAIYIETCLAATTADAVQSTWATIDQSAGTSIFGPQQTISDQNTCSKLQITRQGIRNPPTASVFTALTALLAPRAAAFRLG